jgi:hypothetical protein
MVVLRHFRGAQHPSIPDIDDIIVPSACDEAHPTYAPASAQAAVLSPRQSADFRSVAVHLSNFMLGLPNIRIPD